VRQHEVFRQLRETAPVYWCEPRAQWYVSTFELVDEVLGRPELFSSVGAERRQTDSLPAPVRSEVRTLCEHFASEQLNISDPPEHTRLRRAFNTSFVPRRVERFRPRVESRAARLIDTALRRGQLELMADLAGPLPVQVIAEFMGVDQRHLDDIVTVTLGQRYFFGTTPPDPTVARSFDAALGAWHAILRATFDHRRSSPADDVMTLAARLVDERVLTESEALATCLHLIIAGNSTTTALIGNVLHLLATHPDQRDAVAAAPELAPAAVEEALRFEPPLPFDRRLAVTECRLGGQTVMPGERVVAVLAAACRDPEVFADPDTFDLHRPLALRHQAAFGRGVHLCLGAPLARIEAEIAVNMTLERLPRLELEEGFVHQWHAVGTHRGPVVLPVALPAERTAVAHR
jgi:cytochrome P450